MAEFRVFGAVELRAGDRLLPLGPPKQRVVLTALAVDAGRPVPVETLVQRVWDESPPAEARNALYAHVMRIRRVLKLASPPGGTPPRLEHRDGGYLLDLDRNRIDLHRFRHLVELARAAERPDHERAALLGEALGLWRGVPLIGLSGSWVDRVRDACHQQRLDAVLAWARLELRLGDHGSVIARLCELFGEYPLAEPLAAALIRALAADGRTAEALSCYAAIRERLSDELGVDPGRELRDLHRALLRGDLAEPPRGSWPEPVSPATGQAQPVGDGAGPAATGTGRSAPVRQGADREAGEPVALPVPAQLPPAVSRFAGRDAALGELDALLPEGDPATAPTAVSVITGIGGIGKTALALQWAHRTALHFPDGQLYANLHGHHGDDSLAGSPLAPEAVLEGFLRALGIASARIPPGLGERSALYRSALAGHRMLVLLDNARHAEQVRPLLPGTAGCLVLVTSRDSLAGLVAREGAHRLTLDPLPEPEAWALLRGILGRDRVDADPAATADLCRLCSGLPLALRAAAERLARLPCLHPADLIDELAEPESRLDAFDLPYEGAGVRAALSWSYGTLPEEAARLFRLLGLHRGPHISTPATASLAGVSMPAARHLLDRLGSMHLIKQIAADRYQMHDLIHAYASEQSRRHDTAGARRAALNRLLAHYLHSADNASGRINPSHRRVTTDLPPDGVVAVTFTGRQQAQEWYESERASLVSAVRGAAEGGGTQRRRERIPAAWPAIGLPVHRAGAGRRPDPGPSNGTTGG